MSGDAIKRALEVAKKRLCMCDGECFETRHGMMNGPCEADMHATAAAIAAFLEALPNEMLDTVPDVGYMDAVACRNAWLAAVRRAAGGG